MDDNRRKELYSQLKDIVAELKDDGNSTFPVIEPSDESVLRIYMRDAFGAKERVGG